MSDKEKRRIIYEFLEWLLQDQDAAICQEDPQLHFNLRRVTTWKTYGPLFFTEKYLRGENIKEPFKPIPPKIRELKEDEQPQR